MESDDVQNCSSLLPSASTNTRDVEDEDSRRQVVLAATGTDTAKPAATATSITVVPGVWNAPDPPDSVSPSPPQRPRNGRFQASKDHPRGTRMVDDDRRPTTEIVDGDTESHGRSVSDVEAAILSPEPTTPPTTTTPIWEAYLAPESRRMATVEVVDGVACDNSDSRRSNRRKSTLLYGGTLFVGAAIAVSLWWWTRNRIEDRSVTVETLNGPPSSAPTTLLSSRGRLGDILREIKTHFESPTLEQDLKNPTSPQYRAALWMAEEDAHPTTTSLTYPLNQTSLDLLQFRQRYALATFYYATGGDEWTDRCNFLTPSLHVCDWNCEWDSGPYETLGDDDYFDFNFNVTVMGARCGQSVSDDLVLNLLLGT